MLLLLVALLAASAAAVRIAPRRLRSYHGLALDGRTDAHVQQQRRQRQLLSAAQLQADIEDGTPAERAAAPTPAPSAKRDGGEQKKQDMTSVGNNNAMLGNTLTTDDPYAAAGLNLGKIPY